jgi:hypothetical protein
MCKETLVIRVYGQLQEIFKKPIADLMRIVFALLRGIVKLRKLEMALQRNVHRCVEQKEKSLWGDIPLLQ